MVKVSYGDVVSIHANNKLPLTELSFCIENAAAYMLGRGVWRLKFSRSYVEKDFHVEVEPLVPAKAMTFGFPATLASMAKEDFFPKTIKTADFFSLPGERKQVHDGWNRMVEYSDEGTVILTRDMVPSTQLGLLCYGISDFVTGFFYHGAKTIKSQFSLAVIQHKIDKSYDKTWLKQYLLGRTGTDYPIHALVDDQHLA